MAKSAILNVLEETIGRYVHGLDATSLNVAVWAGKIDVKDLKLDIDAVNKELARQAAEAPNLALPFRVVDGGFANLRVDVPWARITSKPVVLRASGLTATIEPFDHLSGNMEKVIDEKISISKKSKTYSHEHVKVNRDQDERSQSLDLSEKSRQRINAIKRLGEIDEEEDVHDDKSDQRRDSSSVGFKARLVRRIVENLQLDIDDINFNIKGQGCDIGVSVETFSIFTTDQDGKKSFIDRATNSKNVKKSFLYKALQLEGLALYCDEGRHTPSYLKQPYQPMEGRQGKTYILSPLSFSARLRQSDCLKCIDFPKYLLSAELPKVCFRLTRTQLELVNTIANEIQEKKHVFRPLFPEYRPDVPITKKSAKLWWKYAVRCIGRISRRRSWTEFYIAYRKRKLYISLYKQLVYSSKCSWLSPISGSDRTRLDRLEHDKSISLQGIMAWRNMADAQVELETSKFEEHLETRLKRKTPTKKKSAFRSLLFGKKETDDSGRSLLHANNSSDLDHPPIVLSAAEMRELDTLALESASETTLSSDSILCDVSFTMGSFAVDLVTFECASLVSLEMGTVSSSFKANADGSFSSAFTLSSLDVYDRITQNSIFPVVIRSLQSSEREFAFDTFKNAVEIKLSKARNGDQHLEAKLVSYEIVACDVLVTALKKFVTLNKKVSTKKSGHSNPMLQQSITGGMDLFYDANDVLGATTILADASAFNVDRLTEKFVPQHDDSSRIGKFSSAFADAWKSKLEKETIWSVQLRLHAPILVIPKSCTDPLATTLVVDLGTFDMTFGKQVSTQVKKWFIENDYRKIDSDYVKVDHFSLEMEHFSLTVAKAGYKDWLQARSVDQSIPSSSESVIEPVTFKLNIGIENGDHGRRCVFGVLEKISLSISHSQIVQMVSLISHWAKIVEGLSANPAKGIQITEENKNKFQRLSSPTPKTKESEQLKAQVRYVDPVILAHISVVLQQFKARIANNRDESIEVCLLSATAKSTQFSDESSSMLLQMGHFWILDRLEGDFPRRQRLLAHSRLPLPASAYSEEDTYSILESFQRSETVGASESVNALADIKITKSTRGQNGIAGNPFSLEEIDVQTTIIDANFSTLYLYWNPYSVRNLLSFQKDFVFLLDEVKSISSQKLSRGTSDESVIDDQIKRMFVIKANMEAFEVCLNSAKDDLPVFHMEMSNTSISLHSYEASEINTVATVAVGDLRLEMPLTSTVRPEYRTILGLSTNHSSSLLQLKYGKGPLALDCCALDSISIQRTEMFVAVNLSPMRFVHIHAIVFTFIEYMTEGVLGALTERVAESAVQAARKLSETETLGQKVFRVQALGFDVVLPQAAYVPDHFILHAGNLGLDFTSFPTPGEGKALVTLDTVTMRCNNDEDMIKNPICMDINVSLAPLTSPTPHEMATNILVGVSTVAFVLTKAHYSQIMNTLDSNIAEENNFLRAESSANNNVMVMSNGGTDVLKSVATKRLTHGGVEEEFLKKRLYMRFKFEAICLDLCGDDISDPLIAVSAVKSDVFMRLIPDLDQTIFDATMLDLVVEDRRLISTDRQFKKLIQQVSNTDSEYDVFTVSYCKSNASNTTKLDVTFGSPRIVFIPDAVSDVLSFFNNNIPPVTVKVDMPAKARSLPELQVLEVTDDTQKDLKFLEFTLNTEDCSLVLVDMGAQEGSDWQNHTETGIETIVIKGKTSATAKMSSCVHSGSVKKLECEIHADQFEVYAAQSDQLQRPVQIVNPTKVSLFISNKTKEHRTYIDFAFVSLMDFDMTLSMRQYALLLAIAASMNDASTREGEEGGDDLSSIDIPLTAEKTEEICKLADELEKVDEDSTVVISRISRHSTVASHSSDYQTTERVHKIKVTLPHIKITIVNDLQGVDEALFKVTVTSFINNTEVCLSELKSKCIFHSHTFMLIHADYFDAHSSRWEKLLLRPWELDFKAVRGKKKNTQRMATTIDIESHPCQVSFSEQLIIGLKSAAAMWGVFSGANRKAMSIITAMEKQSILDKRTISRRKSIASRAARSLTTTLPYAISNRCGIPIVFITKDKRETVRDCAMVYFQFPLARGVGVGGHRVYGQDALDKKSVTLIVSEQEILLNHVDDEVMKGKQGHHLYDGLVLFTEVMKTGKTTVLYVSSFIDVYNKTCLDFQLSLKFNGTTNLMGVCEGDRTFSQYSSKKNSTPFGLKSTLLYDGYHGLETNRILLLISPEGHFHLTGELELPPFAALRRMANEKKPPKTTEIVCKASGSTSDGGLTVRFVCRVTLVDDYPLVELFFLPRLVLKNNLFVDVFATTPMSGTFSKDHSSDADKKTEGHKLGHFDVIEVFHVGPSVAFAYRIAETPIGGNRTGWNNLGWIDIPIEMNSPLSERVHSSFPFLDQSGEKSTFGGGLEFFLAEESEILDDSSEVVDRNSVSARIVNISTPNLAVDHTGDVLFDRLDIKHHSGMSGASEKIHDGCFTLSSFPSPFHKRRITMLPASESLIYVVKHISSNGNDSFRRSKPFCVDDIAICEGGIESSPIYWEDSTESGLFAYRKLTSFHQSELHVIPEFVIFNGGTSTVRVTIQNSTNIRLDKGKVAIVKRPSNIDGVAISVLFEGHKCASAPVQVDKIGLKVVLVRSCENGSPVGSLAIQTVLGMKDSRFAIKLGHLKHGNVMECSTEKSLIHRDYLHFRVRWSQLEVTFLDTSKNLKTIEGTIQSSDSYKKVAHLILDRFTLDYQKLFKEDAKVDATRTQFSAIIHNIHVSDCTTVPGTDFLSSISNDHNFLDLRVRTRGSGDAGLAKVDLLELKVSHGERKPDQVIINTSEAFLWRLLDIASRTNAAISEFAFTDTNVKWNDQSEVFEVEAIEKAGDMAGDSIDEDGLYHAPRSDMLFAVKRMYVWPSAFLVSFKRNPQAARYQQVSNVKSAKLFVYFLKRLNFTVDRASLRFAGFSCNNVRGPPDRILTSVKAFYIGQLKKKLFTLLTSTSIDQWRQLAGRDDGRESYVEGDILRTTGNLAGRSAGYIVKKVGQGLGQGFASGTSGVGNGFQNVSEAIGVGIIGAGVNSLVTGIGEGVGGTVESVGSGGNKVIKGAGKGVGQIIGGVGGGLQQVAVGIGKGVASGDGSAVLHGIGDGVNSIGTGVIKGTESVVTGAAEGVFSVGKGILGGLSSVTRGVSNAVQGKQPPKRNKRPPRRQT